MSREWTCVHDGCGASGEVGRGGKKLCDDPRGLGKHRIDGTTRLSTFQRMPSRGQDVVGAAMIPEPASEPPTPPDPVPTGDDALVDAIVTGDRRQVLQALRLHLARELRDSAGRDSATISKELRTVMAELANLPDPNERTDVDDIAARAALKLVG